MLASLGIGVCIGVLTSLGVGVCIGVGVLASLGVGVCIGVLAYGGLVGYHIKIGTGSLALLVFVLSNVSIGEFWF